MADQDADKSQDPTPRRRQEAREQGQIPRSQDLGSALLLVIGASALLWIGGPKVDELGRMMRRYLGGEAWLTADVRFVTDQWQFAVFWMGKAVLPLMLAMLLAAVLVNLAQVGFLFLPQRLMPDLTRLNPLKGLGRLFSRDNAVQLFFGVGKTLLVACVAALALYKHRDTILVLPDMSVGAIGLFLVETTLWTTLKIGLALLILALLDYGWQRWRHEQDLKMTPQEVREEMRNQTGDPQILARRRAVQRQLILSRIAQAVPKADVVITNPTELAVAVQYDPTTMNAPVVLAKGAGLVAQRIRRLALENGIPIVERKPLAQALYKQVDVNHPIPTSLYSAVAEVLAYVYQLTGKKIDPVRDRVASARREPVEG